MFMFPGHQQMSYGLFRLHGNGTGTGTPGAMGTNILYKNVHTGERQGE